MTKKKHTIKDIAKLAGVSKGTVDRVLHKRGKVSKLAFEKVDKVLKEIEYLPNPIARNLKNNRSYRICVLIPDAEIDSYWIPAHQGICDAEKEFKPFRILVEKYIYHPKEKNTFIERSKEAMLSNPDVLLMAPLFQEESLLILKQCKEKKIRVALFNNYITTNNSEIFIGQDLGQSGKIAAGLIDKMIEARTKVVIFHINKEPHMQLKEDGFKSYYQGKKRDSQLLETQTFTTENHIQFENDVSSFLKNNLEIGAIFVTNSKAHELVKVLEKHKHQAIVVGYDLLKENVGYLKDGKIDFLIHQKPGRQAYLGIGYFAEFFLFGKKLPSKKLLPIDIISAENVDYIKD
ncbi:MAG: LacI family DNA-binding transcriptional regulator [Pricia sp.]|nr:LacI family DNA-binding transcriptional regulator [Pricia sp.]